MIKITAEKMLYGGFAMARTDKGVVFVEGLLPGETAEVRPNGKKGGIPFYETENIVENSENRRVPNCEYFGKCGGCNWLHIEYDAQIKFKRDIFADAMNRIGKISEFPEPEIFKAEELGYRQRVQLKVDEKTGNVGFYRRQSNEVISISSCPLLTDSLNSLLADHSSFKELSVGKRGIMMIDSGDAVLSKPAIDGKTVSAGKINVGKFHFQIKGDSFFQSNAFLIEKMASWCSEELHGDRLLDLFGGVGLFSLFHGERFKETVLVEMSKSMARSAQKGFEENGFLTGKAFGMSSEHFFNGKHAQNFDAVVVDPPREGLTKEVREGLVKLGSKQILYISCNPSTQARDLGYLVNNGYSLVKTALFDLYPNSSHMESGALLVRQK